MNKKRKDLPGSAARGSQKGHKANDRDPVDILANIVKHAGYAEAQVVAKELDAHHKNNVGTEALQKLETRHRETYPGGEIVWVSGSAKWMDRAMDAAKYKD